MVTKVIVVYFLIPLYNTSWKTLNLPYQSLQHLREVEEKCLSSSLGIKQEMCSVCVWYPNSQMAIVKRSHTNELQKI